VSDIRNGHLGSDPRFLTDFNGVLIFTAYVDDSGHELWRSSGTAATTTMIKDIFPGAASSNPCNYVVFNNKLYFQADDGMYVVGLAAGSTSALHFVVVVVFVIVFCY
jgi:ELWxxDGT repeat protein